MRTLNGIRIFAVFCAIFFFGAPEVAFTKEVLVARKIVVVPVTLDGDSGLFKATGKVNSVAVDFWIDTGASGVALSLDTAFALGLQHKQPIRWVRAFTANGAIPSPIFLVSEISIGDIVVRDIEVGIMPRGANMNLLGNSFLLKLKRFEYQDGVLTLEQ